MPGRRVVPWDVGALFSQK